MFKSLSFKGKVVLVLFFAVGVILGVVIFKMENKTPKQEVAGTETQNDPNHPVEIYYGSPAFQDLDSMISDLAITIYPEDKTEAIPIPGMGIGSKISITRATPVKVTDAKKPTTYRTWENTVGDLLKEKGITLLGQDSASPDLGTSISYNMTVTITRVAEVEVKETETIDYKTIKKNSVDLEKGQTTIETKGVKGEKEVTYIVKRVDGEEVSRAVKDTNVTKEPVTEVQIIGIGPKLAKSGPYKDTINAAVRNSNFNKNYAVNGTAVWCLMMKESTGHPDSINDDPAGPYYGLFQYTESLWGRVSKSAGYDGANWQDPTAQIYSTVWALTHGLAGSWNGTWPRCVNN